jgi:RimJ/RimL family protein N-acetyltransferase
MNDSVALRDVLEEDLPVFFEHQSDPEAAHMAAFPSRGWDAFINHWHKILADPRTYNQTILYDGQVAGNIASFEMDDLREVGYWIGRAYWGKGIATRALAAFLEKDKTRPLYAHVAKHNIASRRVLEKCGFVVTGEHYSDPATGGDGIHEWILTLFDHK